MTEALRADTDSRTLSDTIEALAAYERAPCSEGERRAAEWLAERFAAAGAAARIEEERSFSSFPKRLAAMCAGGVAAGLGAIGGKRVAAAVLGLVSATAIATDVSNLSHFFRLLAPRRRRTWNVVAEAGDSTAARTLVVLAHHDAAQTGAIFSQSAQKKVWEIYPELIERTDTGLPLWWLVVGGPIAAALGGIFRSRRLGVLGALLSAGSFAAFADVARSDIVPGANDNLSGVAVLVAFAESLRERPLEGLRVLLVSCGSEEVLQGGIHGFAGRHFPALDPGRTWVVNHDSVGSPKLALLEGEGPMVMEDFQPAFKDLVEDVARDAAISLRRGLRSRFSTDSVVPHRAGYPVASFTSVNAWKALSNYHWPTDVPENVDYSTVADAARLTRLLADRLAG